jgi:hypothetical protein
MLLTAPYVYSAFYNGAYIGKGLAFNYLITTP